MNLFDVRTKRPRQDCAQCAAGSMCEGLDESEAHKMKANSNPRQKKQLLSDHQKMGKRFIPPMMQFPREDVNWRGKVVPEFLWLGLLNERYGVTIGSDLCVMLARAAAQANGVDAREFKKKFGQSPKQWFATTSSYDSLTDKQRRDIVKKYMTARQRNLIYEALSPLISFYPHCPFKFLFDDVPSNDGKEELIRFKSLLSQLFDKYTEPATFMLAGAVLIGFCTNRLRVIVNDDRQSEDISSLANFPAVQNYPHTEQSRAVAAGIRGSVYSLCGFDSESQEWCDYFWNRGLELEPCEPLKE